MIFFSHKQAMMELIPSPAEGFYSQYLNTARTEGHKEKHKEKEWKRLEGQMTDWINWQQKQKEWAAAAQSYSIPLKSISIEQESFSQN